MRYDFMNISPCDIGIIGGADGPTSILVSASSDLWIYAVAAAVAVGIIATLIIKKKRKK